MQHLVGVCLHCHCCSSPSGSRFPSRCCTASFWCQFRCVACSFIVCADVQMHANACKYMQHPVDLLPALSLLQFPPWQQVPFKMLHCISLVPVRLCGCLIVACGDVQVHVAFCRCLLASLLQFPPWQQVPSRCCTVFRLCQFRCVAC